MVDTVIWWKIHTVKAIILLVISAVYFALGALMHTPFVLSAVVSSSEDESSSTSSESESESEESESEADSESETSEKPTPAVDKR